MENKFREYIDKLFATAPHGRKTVELKEELVQNLMERYNDLVSQGKSEVAAYNIAVASVGEVDELLSYLKKPEQPPAVSPEEMERAKRRSALFVSSAVALYVACPVPLFLLQNPTGLVLLILVAAIATFLIIYHSMTQPKYLRNDDTLIEEFREWQNQNTEEKTAMKSVSTAIWCLTTVLYFVVSFGTMAWHITWLIFLIGTAVNAVARAAFDLRKKGNT